MDMQDHARPRWRLNGRQLEFGGAEVLLLGGQVHNSTSSHPAAIDEAFARTAGLGANTVLAPVCWDLVEPEEGRFDFGVVDHLLRSADAHGLRLVPLWFGGFKNAGSTYSPRWVRADRARFPRAVTHGTIRPAFTYEGATAKPVLSVFSTELVTADATAFEAFMTFLAAHPLRDVVPLVQVENEVGLLADSRDRSAPAQRIWDAPVPTAFIDALRGFSTASMAGTIWREHGARADGSWAALLGDDWRADEVFMAWGFASYVERVAARGAAVWPVPLSVNAWLGPQPGQDRPGLYPSGGPASRVLDVWRAVAPSIALLTPDIYVDDAAPVIEAYAAGEAPLFVPECRPRAGDIVTTLAAGGMGWSVFGVEDLQEESLVAGLLRLLTAAERDLVSARATGRLFGAAVGPDEEREIRVDGLTVTLRATGALFRRMFLDAGVFVPDPVPGQARTETLPGVAVSSPRDERAFGLIVAESSESFLVIGRDLTIDVASAEGDVEIDRVVELRHTDGRWVEGRALNGDERLRVLPFDEVGAVRIRILRSAAPESAAGGDALDVGRA